MKNLLLLFALVTMATCAYANKVLISNVSIINNGPNAIVVQFDISWEKSWRTNIGPANYDGVWVFFKYKTASGDWTHITLTGGNNVIGTGYSIFQNGGFTKTGAMIYRDQSNLGIGNVAVTGIQLGVQSNLPYNIDVKAFAIEMVYVPAPIARPFFGDGNGTTESANAFHYADNTASNSSVIPMLTDANAYDDGELDADGIYIYSIDTIQLTNPIGSLDAFPTMKALWCMKYEINQAGYRDFLNTLNFAQQANRTYNYPSNPKGTPAMYYPAYGAYRSNIVEVTPGVYPGTPAVYGCNLDGNDSANTSTDGEWIACGFLSYPDVAAYLDWSGLAPMSELQFERICRGTTSAGANAAVYGEYAWGTATIDSVAYTISGAGTTSELATNAPTSIGNAIYASTYTAGPVRSGMFATATSTRISSGAAFYGVMDMTGNLAEYVISIGTVAGRSVKLVPNGDGFISPNGFAQLPVGNSGYWPGMEGNSNTASVNTCYAACEVSGAAGIILRGGGFTDVKSALPIAYRGGLFTPNTRDAARGGRGVLYIR